jgi:hypothetical protein
MIDTELALRQLITLSGVPVPEDELLELIPGLDGLIARVENLYSVPVGDTPPTSMLRVEA